MSADLDKKSLTAQVARVGKPWETSTYYANAERTTSIFWNDRSIFRKHFNELDLTNVVELACGYGRHAEQCATMCGHITLVDIFDDNLNASKARLTQQKNVSFLKNNGFDFEPLPPNAYTAIYCYDAMVHFSPDIVASYLLNGAKILREGGLMLLHHSNYIADPPDKNYGKNPCARNHMPYDMFEQFTADAGLETVRTTVMAWGGVQELDRVTLLRKPAAR